MLSKEEMIVFLAMLLKFSLDNELSATRCGQVFGVSHMSLARWIRFARDASRGIDPPAGIYRYLAEPVELKINKLNALDTANGMYTAIKREKPAKKVEILSRALDGQTV